MPTAADSTLFRLLVEHGTDATILLDVETEACIYVSPAVHPLLGREPAALIGCALADLVHPEDAMEVLARTLRRCEGKHVRKSVARMRHADGRWIWVEATASTSLRYRGRTTTVVTVSGAADRVRAEVGLRAARRRLCRLLDRMHLDNEGATTGFITHDPTVEALAAALEMRDDETGQHARRVTDLALELTRAIDPELAAHPELRHAYLLHDIGKIGIPDAILRKPTRLTRRELRTLQMHPTLGEHLLSCIPFHSDLVHDVVAYHHEQWDGNGYPWGLRRDETPLAARIFAVVDAFDAITHDRPYRRARSTAEAIIEIERGAGTQFDAAVVAAFLPMAQGPAQAAASRPTTGRARREGV
jgi:PAS domain S-box-containing protein